MNLGPRHGAGPNKAAPGRTGLQLWGGVEATIARIGASFRDQCVETGHRDRPEDLGRIAALGIRTLRYPVLWESVAPRRPGELDWSWHDARLKQLRQLGIRPVVGLLHHGSGPVYTNLLDPDFPKLFADFAAQVARRYPWIALYTPINEPLTTARFSALYGHWFPHARDDRAFLAALMAECEATVLAMRAIRAVNPAAQLVQTEDFGRTFSTPALADQAEHENQRRWLSFDLLGGRVNAAHPLWPFLRREGVSERSLAVFEPGDSTPDILGINHYLTSERFLDERRERYPTQFWGGNGRQLYADVEAVRMHDPGGALGPAARLMEVWNRYRRPIVVTEVHHGCSRDEQLRWVAEVWHGAGAARAQGADVRAVTIWSLFGAVDWRSLLTRRDGHYEPGIFDVRGGAPRVTALAVAARSLARTGHFDHPVLDAPGWWRRPNRFYDGMQHRPEPPPASEARKILLVGPDSPLTQAFLRVAQVRGLFISRADRVNWRPDWLDDTRIWAVIDAQGGAALPLGNGARRAGLRTMRIALGAEQDSHCDGTLTIRTGLLFGPWDKDNPAYRLLAEMAAGAEVKRPNGMVAPSYLPDLVHAALDLLVDGETGTWQLTSPEAVSWATFAVMLAERAGLSLRMSGGDAERNPAGNLRIRGPELMPGLTSILDRFVAELEEWPEIRRPSLPIAAE